MAIRKDFWEEMLRLVRDFGYSQEEIKILSLELSNGDEYEVNTLYKDIPLAAVYLQGKALTEKWVQEGCLNCSVVGEILFQDDFLIQSVWNHRNGEYEWHLGVIKNDFVYICLDPNFIS